MTVHVMINVIVDDDPWYHMDTRPVSNLPTNQTRDLRVVARGQLTHAEGYSYSASEVPT